MAKTHALKIAINTQIERWNIYSNQENNKQNRYKIPTINKNQSQKQFFCAQRRPSESTIHLMNTEIPNKICIIIQYLKNTTKNYAQVQKTDGFKRTKKAQNLIGQGQFYTITCLDESTQNKI